MPEGACLLLR